MISKFLFLNVELIVILPYYPLSGCRIHSNSSCFIPDAADLYLLCMFVSPNVWTFSYIFLLLILILFHMARAYTLISNPFGFLSFIL